MNVLFTKSAPIGYCIFRGKAVIVEETITISQEKTTQDFTITVKDKAAHYSPTHVRGAVLLHAKGTTVNDLLAFLVRCYGVCFNDDGSMNYAIGATTVRQCGKTRPVVDALGFVAQQGVQGSDYVTALQPMS